MREPYMLGNFSPAGPPLDLPAITSAPEASDWLHENVLQPLLEETRKERF